MLILYVSKMLILYASKCLFLHFRLQNYYIFFIYANKFALFLIFCTIYSIPLSLLCTFLLPHTTLK